MDIFTIKTRSNPYKWIIISLLLRMVSADVTEYVKRIEYCKNHLSATAIEDTVYNEIINGNSGERYFETLKDCFRYKYFNKELLNDHATIIQASPSNLTRELNRLPENTSILFIDIASEQITEHMVQVRKDISVQLDIQPIYRFLELEELWIFSTAKDYNPQYVLNCNSTPTQPLRIEKLHLNLPVFSVIAPQNFFGYLPNLTLLDLDGIVHFGLSFEGDNEIRTMDEDRFSGCDSMLKFECILHILRDAPLRVLSLSEIQKFMSRGECVNERWSSKLDHFPKLLYLNISNNVLDLYTLSLIFLPKQIVFLDISQNGLHMSIHQNPLVNILLELRELLYLKLGPMFPEYLSGIDFYQVHPAFCVQKTRYKTCKTLSKFTFGDIFNKTKICLHFLCLQVNGKGLPDMVESCMNMNISIILDHLCPDPQNPFRFPLPFTIQEFDISRMSMGHRSFTMTSPGYCFGKSSLRYIDLSRNADTLSTYTFTDVFNHEVIDFTESNLEILHLGYNAIPFQDVTFLNGFFGVGKKLILSGNFFSEDFLSRLCGTQAELQSLILADANITHIAKNSFHNCKSLKYLDISNNDIQVLTLNHLPSLRLLNLHNNRISIIENSFFDYMNRNMKLLINISGNSLDCTCNHESLKTVEGLQRVSHSVIDYHNLMCANGHGYSFIHDMNIQEIREMCFPSQLLWIISSTVSCILTLCVTVSGFYLYKYRFSIKTLFYKFRYRKRLGSSNIDFYVMHSHADRYWVYNLPRQLESRFNFNLIIPDRDFSANDYEYDQVLMFLTRCRAILVVISEDFIADHQCRHDLSLAFDQRRMQGKPIISVKLGKISSQMTFHDSTIREILSARDYIKYPRIEDGLKEKMESTFWYKLANKCYGALSSRIELNMVNGLEMEEPEGRCDGPSENQHLFVNG